MNYFDLSAFLCLYLLCYSELSILFWRKNCLWYKQCFLCEFWGIEVSSIFTSMVSEEEITWNSKLLLFLCVAWRPSLFCCYQSTFVFCCAKSLFDVRKMTNFSLIDCCWWQNQRLQKLLQHWNSLIASVLRMLFCTYFSLILVEYNYWFSFREDK